MSRVNDLDDFEFIEYDDEEILNESIEALKNESHCI